MKYFNRDRGVDDLGTTGTVIVDRDGYEIYDLNGKKVSEFKSQAGPQPARPTSSVATP